MYVSNTYSILLVPIRERRSRICKVCKCKLQKNGVCEECQNVRLLNYYNNRNKETVYGTK
jgi:hypothetical protein